MRREQHQVEAVLDLVDAIFNGDTGHRLVTPYRYDVVIRA
jgi:hypothetical protein